MIQLYVKYMLISCSDIPVKFDGTEAVVKENENFAKLDIFRENSGVRNVKEAMLRVHEDLNNGGCLKSKFIYMFFTMYTV